MEIRRKVRKPKTGGPRRRPINSASSAESVALPGILWVDWPGRSRTGRLAGTGNASRPPKLGKRGGELAHSASDARSSRRFPHLHAMDRHDDQFHPNRPPPLPSNPVVRKTGSTSVNYDRYG